MPIYRRALLTLALLAATLSAAAVLYSSAGAQQIYGFPTSMSRVAADTWYDGDSWQLSRAWSALRPWVVWDQVRGGFQHTDYQLEGDVRPSELTVSGTVTVETSFSHTIVSPPVLSDFRVTNGTLSNVRQGSDNKHWLIDVTPTADGTVRVWLPFGTKQSSISSSFYNSNAQRAMTAELGAPKVVWADFVPVYTTKWRFLRPLESFVAGDEIDLTVIFSEHVTVTGNPTVRLGHTGSPTGDITATYVSGSGSSTLVFRHTVPAGGYSSGRTTLGATSLDLPAGAAIVDGNGNAANLALPPQFLQRELSGPAANAAQNGHGTTVGDEWDYTATFSEPVFVTRDSDDDFLPFFRVLIETNADEQKEVRAEYVSGSGTTQLTFRYVVAAADDVKRVIGGSPENWLLVPGGSYVRNEAGTRAGKRLWSLSASQPGPPPCDLELVLSLVDDSDNVVSPGDTLTIAAKLTYVDTYRPLTVTQPGALRIVADYQEWEANERRRVAISRGVAGPCTRVITDGLHYWTCTLRTEDTTIVLPRGAPHGSMTISGEVEIDGLPYSASLDITIGDVDEVESATLGFATDIAPGDSTDTPAENWTHDDRPYPSKIAAGERTTLQLAILNENNAASAAGDAINSVVLTTTAGSLSLLSPDGACLGGGHTCQLPVNLLNVNNSDNILIELAHPGGSEPSVGVVRAVVISSDGQQIASEPISVTLTGVATTLAISQPATSLLNLGTPDSGPERDNLDLLTLSVTAADAAGNSVLVPSLRRTAVLRDPSSETIWGGIAGLRPSGVQLDWPLRARDAADALLDTDPDTEGVQTRLQLDADGNLQVRIDVDATAAAALATGEYTLEISAGGLTTTRAFRVSGGAATLALSEPQGEQAIGSELTFTASLTDEEGAPVADGTPVAWREASASADTVLVQTAADTRTADGQASATYLVVSSGTVAIRASSGAAVDVRTLQNLAAPPAPPGPADSLSTREPGAMATWLGTETATASELLAALEDISAISIWSYSMWVSYTPSSPSADNFLIHPGAIIRLSG